MANIGKASLIIVPTFDGLTEKVERALGSASSSASRSGSSLGQKTASGFGRGLASSGAVIGAFSAITSKAMDSISAHVGSAVSRFDTLNNYPKVMQSLGYSSKDADASIALMSDRLSTLPTRLDDMVSVVQGIVVSTHDLDKATKAGLALNDMLVASGSSTQLTNAAMEQFRQILAKGKPEMQDWRSLTSAMPGQMDQLAKSMLGASATASDLYYALGGGKDKDAHTEGIEWASVSCDQLLDAMIRLDTEGGDSIASFQSQAETAAGGVQTSMDNLSNAVTKGLTATMDAIGKDNIASVLRDAKDGVNSLFREVNSGVSEAMPGIKGLYEGLKENAGTIATFAASAGAIDVVGTKVANGVTRLREYTSATKEAGGRVSALGAANSLLGTSFTGVGIAVAAASALVGAGIALWSDYTRKTEALDKATDGLNDAVSQTTALSDYSSRVGDVAERAEFSAKSVDQLAESIGKSVDAMNSNTQAAETQIATLETARGIIDSCAGKTDLSTDAQGRLEWALRQVNDQLGTSITQTDVLNGSYEDQDGNVRDLTSSIGELIAKKEQEARVNALTENLTEAYKDQAEAAKTLADAQNAYDDAVQRYVDKGYELEQARNMASMGTQEGKDLKAAQEMYDSTTDSVARLSDQLGVAATAASTAGGAMEAWASSAGPLFSAQLESHGQSVSALCEDLTALGADTEALADLSDEGLAKLASDYDGTTASVVGDLERWHVGMDETARKTALAAGDIKSTIDGMSGLGDALAGANVGVSDFAEALADAGVATEDLNSIGSENLKGLAEACGGNMDAMVWYIQHYNDTPIQDKDGNINIDQAQLIDAQGRVYTWNGSQLVDKDGNAAVEDTELTDAQGNLWTWNGTALQSKDGAITISENGVEKAFDDRENWNSGSWLDKAATATVNIVRSITDFFTGGSGNARGGFRTHADGAIVTRAMPLDIVGEAGAEAIVPLTNRRYSEPFARTLAEQMGQAGTGEQVTRWLGENLPRIIAGYTPVMGRRSFVRAVNEAVTQSA